MKVYSQVVLIVILFTVFGCETNIENNEETPVSNIIEQDTIVPVAKDSIIETSKIPEKIKVPKPVKTSNVKLDSLGLEVYLKNFGLVNIQEVEPSIRVDLKYSTTDNFVGIDMYGDLTKAFCQPDVAEKLKKAYQYLQEEDSTLTLLVFDAVRPVFVQQKMWDTLKMPIREKTKFLSNPRNHSIHNYGAAVDISLTTKDGEELDMGTPFDFIGKLAHPREEKRLLKEGKLTQKQIENRVLLRKVMKKAGFFNIQTEWWHWNSCSRNTAKSKYKVVR
ncbi:M15 family metallopeptidase [Flavobacteriales bacterium]|jgi:D-alanyl-D-alanine dipeptidase|nr:M15 family metallopeptidase [Flavobacteriales bacterium]